MTNVIPFPMKKEIPYFGGCPKCFGTDGCLNIGRDHWFICREHRVKWHVRSIWFSDWREKTEQDWLENKYLLVGYREVEPVSWRIPELGEENS